MSEQEDMWDKWKKIAYKAKSDPYKLSSSLNSKNYDYNFYDNSDCEYYKDSKGKIHWTRDWPKESTWDEDISVGGLGEEAGTGKKGKESGSVAKEQERLKGVDQQLQQREKAIAAKEKKLAELVKAVEDLQQKLKDRLDAAELADDLAQDVLEEAKEEIS